MRPIASPRPMSCTSCGQSSVTPQIRKNVHGKKIITEAHYICTRCGSRFNIGILGEEEKK